MPFLIGVLLALAVAIFARLVGFERDRAFYPTVLIVIGCLYGLFAVMGGSMSALAAESPGMIVFTLLAVFGFKRSPWLLVVGLAGHGVFDFFHGHLITNPGVPTWWPMFCGAYDVTAAIYLAWLLLRAWHSRGATEE
ncbi:MAG: hypothetical protein PSW75_00910 [bacterium]|nr:hypothetical protein [bacterium]MDI1337724.1 hypothetical protein [Lacunisphaera sp.]